MNTSFTVKPSRNRCRGPSMAVILRSRSTTTEVSLCTD